MSLLSARNLSKHFGGVVALSGFHLAIEPGDLLGLIGPNGAGKTTAFNLLTAVLAPSAGEIRFNGTDITRTSPEARARLGMTRTFQNIRLFDDLTVCENVMAGAHAAEGAPALHSIFATSRHRRCERRIREVAEQALERTGLSDFADQRASALAYGDRRRVEIARALASGPRLMLLDEPAAGMNEKEKAALSDLIRQLNEGDGLSIVLVEHNVRMVAALCRRLVVMNKGEILAEGATDNVLRLPEVEQVYLGRRRNAAGTA
jgi:branched-chain amino acid transport system ATP-binding protein